MATTDKEAAGYTMALVGSALLIGWIWLAAYLVHILTLEMWYTIPTIIMMIFAIFIISAILSVSTDYIRGR